MEDYYKNSANHLLKGAVIMFVVGLLYLVLFSVFLVIDRDIRYWAVLFPSALCVVYLFVFNHKYKMYLRLHNVQNKMRT